MTPKRRTIAERARDYLREHGHDEGADAIELYDLAKLIKASPRGLLKAIRLDKSLRIWQEVWIDDTKA